MEYSAFAPHYSTHGELRGFHCAQCCESISRSRLVRKCWHPECMKECRFYDLGCVPRDLLRESAEQDRNYHPSSRLFGSGEYQRHFRARGECVFCEGTGLDPSPGQKECLRCQGTGKCPACQGRFLRSLAELPAVEKSFWIHELELKCRPDR